MRYPKLRELKEAVRALIKGPYTSKFPAEPHIPFPRFRGKPVPDEKECIGCGACAEVCPAGAIEVTDSPKAEPPMRKLTWHYGECIFCGQCERYCTTKKGVKLSNEFDLAVLDRKTLESGVKKELLLCEQCGEIIGAKDQVMWTARKLGPEAYGNTLTANALLGEVRSPEEPQPEKMEPPLNRTRLFRILCPRCRHKAAIFDEYGNI